jgi:predicted protein tyrosine phosphatase
MNLLFICSRNQWRSPTAECIYKKRDGISARSAGTSSSARIKVNADMIKWADIIFVMEIKHKQRLEADYPGAISFKTLHVLHIPDEYKFMDKELVEVIEASVDPYL